MVALKGGLMGFAAQRLGNNNGSSTTSRRKWFLPVVFLTGCAIFLSDSYFLEDYEYIPTESMTAGVRRLSTTKQSRQDTSLLFVSQRPGLGSSTMRGVQVMDEWRRQGNTFELSRKVTGCGHVVRMRQQVDICVFIGPCVNREIFPKEANCKVKVLDVVDKYLFGSDLIHATMNDYDAIIVNSSYMRDHFRDTLKYKGEIKVLLHHSDPRWHVVTTKKASATTLQFGYVGSIPSMDRDGNFLNHNELQRKYPITMVDTDKRRIPHEVNFEMDVSIRPLDKPVAKFKTSAKVATAAALGHNIITTWEEATKDALPPDYPFALNGTSYEDVSRMFDLAVNDYEGDQVLWKKGLEMMKHVNEKLKIEALAVEYEEFLDELVEKLLTPPPAPLTVTLDKLEEVPQPWNLIPPMQSTMLVPQPPQHQGEGAQEERRLVKNQQGKPLRNRFLVKDNQPRPVRRGFISLQKRYRETLRQRQLKRVKPHHKKGVRLLRGAGGQEPMSSAAASILQQQEAHREAIAALDAENRRKTSVQGQVDGGFDAAYAQEDYYLMQQQEQQEMHGRRTLGPEFNPQGIASLASVPQEAHLNHEWEHEQQQLGPQQQHDYHQEYGHAFMGDGNYHAEQPQSEWSDQFQPLQEHQQQGFQ